MVRRCTTKEITPGNSATRMLSLYFNFLLDALSATPLLHTGCFCVVASGQCGQTPRAAVVQLLLRALFSLALFSHNSVIYSSSINNKSILALMGSSASCCVGLAWRFWAALLWVLSPILYLVNPKHNLPYASPARPPPDPVLFPRYMQNKQGIWLHWAEWTTRKNPTSVVFIVSGLGEHSGRYDSVALSLVSQGCHVFAMDHQGQGGSEGDRCYVERFQDYVDDMQMFVNRMLSHRTDLSVLPRFLLGHSMGGLISVHLALRDPTMWNGVVLSAPALEADPKVATPFLKSLASLLSEVVPKLPLDKIDLETLSKNRAVVELAYQDPYYPSVRMKARWGSEMLLAMDAVWARVHNVAFPYLLLHSSDDRICHISGSRKFHQLSPSTDKAFKEYKGMFHELFTELQRHVVLNEVHDFIAQHIK